MIHSEQKPIWLNLIRIFDRYILTDNHLSYNTGFLTRNENKVLYKQITDVDIRRNALQYIIGTGDVIVKTQNARVREELTLYDLVDFREVATYLLNESSKKGFVDAM